MNEKNSWNFFRDNGRKDPLENLEMVRIFLNIFSKEKCIEFHRNCISYVYHGVCKVFLPLLLDSVHLGVFR